MRIATLLPLLFSLFAFVVAVYLFLQNSGQDRSMLSAYGSVISKSVVEGQGRSVIQFMTESGQVVTFQSQSELSPYYDQHETVYVRYSLSRPENAQDVVEAAQKDKTIPMLLALIACAVGLVALIKMGSAAEASFVLIGKVGLACLGLVFLGGGVFGIDKTQQNKDALLHTQGQIVDVIAVQSNANQPGNYEYQQTLYYPIIKFTTAIGQHWTIKSETGYPVAPYKVGDTAAIKYDANQPYLATLQGSPASSVLKLIWLILGVVCLVLSLRFWE